MLMLPRIHASLLLVFALLLTADPILQGRGAEVLKLEWQEGRTYLHKVESDWKSKIAIGEQELDMAMKTKMELEMKIGAITDDENKEVILKYKRFAIDMSGSGTRNSWDSNDPGAGSGKLDSLGNMVARKFTMILNENNDIVEVTGTEEMVADLEKSELGSLMNEHLSRRHFEWMTGAWAGRAFPEKPVKPGDSWPLDERMARDQLGFLTFKGRFTLTGYQKYNGHECAVIELDGAIKKEHTETDADAQASYLKGLDFEMKDGKIKGRLFFDPKARWWRGMEIEQGMTTFMKNPADGSEEMVTPSSGSIKMLVEIK